MKLYIELILTVSLTGTIPFCIYLLLKKWFEARISAAFQYKLLKLLLLCFIFPFSLIKSLVVNGIAPKSSIIFDKYIHLGNSIVQTVNGYQLIPKGEIHKIIIPVWFVLLIIIICYQFYRYFYFRHKFIRRLKPDILHQKELTVQKKQLGIDRQISLLCCNAAISPFTYGIFHPCIVITSVVSEEAIPMTIRHELQHIKSYDFVFRAIAFVAVLLHCWNPFIYLLWKELYEIQEIACDEEITKSLSPDKVRQYGYSLVGIADSVQHICGLAPQMARNNKKEICRRIIRLSMHFKKRSIITSALLFISCLIGFCIPVYACSPEIFYLGIENNEDFSSTDWIIMEQADNSTPVCPGDEFHFQETNQYLILENGTITHYPINELLYEKKKASCSHSWQSARLKKHDSDGKGGCTVFTYSVDVCTKCSLIKNQTLISENHYVVCPH